MSADNEIAISRWKTKDGFEYRVKEIQGSDNLFHELQEIQEATRFLYFHDVPILPTKEEAYKQADRIYYGIIKSDFPILEYGITLYDFDVSFPDMTLEQAKEIINGENYD